MNPLNWQKDTPQLGCLNCGGGEMVYEVDGTIRLRASTDISHEGGMGVHFWTLRRNGEELSHDYGRLASLDKAISKVEAVHGTAKSAKASTWTLSLNTPLRGATYRRYGKGRWLLVSTNEGYA